MSRYSCGSKALCLIQQLCGTRLTRLFAHPSPSPTPSPIPIILLLLLLLLLLPFQFSLLPSNGFGCSKHGCLYFILYDNRLLGMVVKLFCILVAMVARMRIRLLANGRSLLRSTELWTLAWPSPRSNSFGQKSGNLCWSVFSWICATYSWISFAVQSH